MNPPVPSAPPLDPLTLCLAVSVLGFLLAAIAANIARGAPAQRAALRLWSATMAAAGAAFLLYYLRGFAPLLLTYALGNSIAVSVPALGLHAYARLLALRLPLAPTLATLLLAAASAVAGWAGLVPIDRSAGALSALTSGLLFTCTVLLLRQPAVRQSRVALLGAVAAGFTALALAVRAFTAFGGTAQMVYVSGPNPQLAPMLLLSTLFIVASSMGFFAIVHEQQRRQLMEHARRDGLTGVYTRGAFHELAAAHAGPCAVLMLDLDHFKQINDGFGHRGGDLTLAHAARLLMGAVRIDDLVGRYGGEEFCVLLRGCGEAEAAALAQRMVQDARAAGVRLPDGRQVRYTLSAGYAVRAAGEPLEDLIERADRALYHAKRAGRDRAAAAPGLEPSGA